MTISQTVLKIAAYRNQKKQELIKIAKYKLAGLLPEDYKQKEVSYLPSLKDCLIAAKKYVMNLPVTKRNKIETIENKL
jgi:TPP-dependent pyruvate/acetoin dehydrogenase alpha subunit